MRAKGFFNMLVAFVMMASCPQAWALKGTGTAEDPYLLYTAADMREFADIVNGTNGQKRNKSACATLMADIPNLGEWTPIGNSGGHFMGTFDGQGHRIDGMTITNYTKVNQGLFGYIEDAMIKNFYLSGKMTSDTKITGGDNDCTGTVVGYAIGSSTIQYVASSVDMTLTKEQKHLGGIVGQINDKTIVSVCEYSGTLDAGPTKDCIGGIVGFMHAYSRARIEFCSFIGHINSTGSGPTIGGILGYINSVENDFKKMTTCLSGGEFTYEGSDKYVNAIIGRAIDGSTLFIHSAYRIFVGGIFIYDGNKYRAFNEQAEYHDSGLVLVNEIEAIKWGFAAGTLNSCVNRENVWRQDLGKDEVPSMNPEKPIVYRHDLSKCGYTWFESYYSNNPEETIYHTDLVKVEKKDPVGCKSGYKEHYKCPKCKVVFNDTTSIHTFSVSDYKHNAYLTGAGGYADYSAYIPPVEEHHWNLDSTYCDRCGQGFVKVRKLNNAESIVMHNYDWKIYSSLEQCDYDYDSHHSAPDSPFQTFEMTGKIMSLAEHMFENEKNIVELYSPSTVQYTAVHLFKKAFETPKNVEFHSIPSFTKYTMNFDPGNHKFSATLHLNDDSFVNTHSNPDIPPFESIKYTRLQVFEWGTLCVPFELDMDDQECTFYNLVDVEDDVLVVEEAHGHLAIGKPIIYHVDPELLADGPHKITFHGCKTKVNATTKLTLPEVNGLIPTGHYNRRKLKPGDGYMLSKDSFREEVGLEEGESVSQGPFRCTLVRANTSKPSNVKAYTLRVRDTDATGILDVADTQRKESQYYSIDGKRLAQPQKGLNIVRTADGTWRKVVE